MRGVAGRCGWARDTYREHELTPTAWRFQGAVAIPLAFGSAQQGRMLGRAFRLASSKRPDGQTCNRRTNRLWDQSRNGRLRSGRKKDLDLVIARPLGEPDPTTFAQLAQRYKVVLDAGQQATLAALPALHAGAVGGVLLALEAKAAMTEHGKARPRLYDELESSHTAVHGASRQALAIGLVLVNASTTFVSPDLNKGPTRPVVSTHRQPAAIESTISKVTELPRRSDPSSVGFDGLGIVVLSAANDGTPVSLVSTPPAPHPGDIFFYDNMISRAANEYDTRFASI